MYTLKQQQKSNEKLFSFSFSKWCANASQVSSWDIEMLFTFNEYYLRQKKKTKIAKIQTSVREKKNDNVLYS